MCGINKQLLDELQERDARETPQEPEREQQKLEKELAAIPLADLDDNLEPAFSAL
ncbi:MAG: hypothetical protein ACREGH_00810 [Minisyncoccia bacterium]